MLGRPRDLIQRPGLDPDRRAFSISCVDADGAQMSGDPLSDLLRTVRLTGAAFFDVAATDPWVVEQPPPEMFLPKILPGADRLISYHVVTEGRCFANIVGDEPIVVEAGEVIVITNGDAHVMSSSPGMRAAPAAPEVLAAVIAGPLPFFVKYGADGPPTAKLVCGFLACDVRPFNPLLDALPPVMKAKDSPDRPAGWLGQFIRFAQMESADKRAGSESVLAKLSELMFIEVVRRHLETMPAERAGWLAGLRDPFVGKALSLMHGKAAHSWTIGELAKRIGLSRSVLAERFGDLVGMPPMQYLGMWRMQMASGMLSGGSASVASIAEAIGYESEAAFSRAFKKIVGVSPSVWRHRAQPARSRPKSRPSVTASSVAAAKSRKSAR
jgi:AraC-like DNA-binding protein